jgi:hypothetical protein
VSAVIGPLGDAALSNAGGALRGPVHFGKKEGTGPMVAKKHKKKNTASKSQLLEHTVEGLGYLDFLIYRSLADFKKQKGFPKRNIISPHETSVFPDCRYAIRSYPHPTIYGTPGKKEVYFQAPDNGRTFFVARDGIIRCLIEDKFQDKSGSTDEKIPFLWESFLASPILNWIVVFGGGYWKTPRGEAVVQNLRYRANGIPGPYKEKPINKKMHVVTREEFHELIRNAFSGGWR